MQSVVDKALAPRSGDRDPDDEAGTPVKVADTCGYDPTLAEAAGSVG